MVLPSNRTSNRPSGKSTTSTLLPMAACAKADGSTMKRMLSYWSVRDCDRVRSARHATASSSRSPTEGSGDPILDALGGQSALEMCDGAEHVEEKFADG